MNHAHRSFTKRRVGCYGCLSLKLTTVLFLLRFHQNLDCKVTKLMAKVKRERDVSTRLLRPTLPEIRLDDVMSMVEQFDPKWETDAGIQVYDEGIAQYSLIDPISHSKFYAALILSKPSLRCTIVAEEPGEELEAKGNAFKFVATRPVVKNDQNIARVKVLKEILKKRGYQFTNQEF
ncbi:hypothetical protein M3Y98_00215700 [Aphelenchoides besseyi]|nr:hypothetical protein M3Y98_00215700 [Aphelenchoides besseyi]